jgi:predicted transcriptional regulator of viral defense system
MVNLSKKNSAKFSSLTDYLNQLQMKDKHYFLTLDIEEALGMKKASISSSLSRLAKKKRLKMVKKGFGILLGSDGKEPHPSSYIDAMMKHINADYYVALLSAASHWGASHQSNMSYQVFSNKTSKDIAFERGRVEFITKKDMKFEKWVKRVSTIYGYFNVSSPELTAIDLISFPKKCGHLNNIATVLDELAEKWDGRVMASLCLRFAVPTIVLQRLGYILDEVLLLPKESSYIEKALKERKPTITTLSKLIEGKKMSDYSYNEKWKIYINTEVEAD